MKLFLAKCLAHIGHWGQKRKYTGEPYIVHPRKVVNILKIANPTKEQEMAAWMHDLVEDTWVRPWMIQFIFGKKVATYVWWLTDVSKLSDGNRAIRKEKDRQHIALAPPEVKTVKLADIIDNSCDIVQHDEKFAKVYMAEKERLMEVLKEGDPILWDRANSIVKLWKVSSTIN